MKSRSTAASVSVAAMTLWGCGPGAPPLESNEEDLTQSASLMYEGSCNWLSKCSTPSIAAGHVVWGCSSIIPSLQNQSCSDNMLWLAVPNTDYCGIPIHLCTPSGRCADVQGWDISNKGGWEGSPAVMDALGLPRSEKVAACSGTGGGTVSVSRGMWGNWIDTTIVAKQTSTLTFSPGKAGNHAIDYANIYTIPTAGTIQFCWRSGTGSWSCWATEPETYQVRRRILYSGSADINYKFVITNTAGKTATFSTRFYTGW